MQLLKGRYRVCVLSSDLFTCNLFCESTNGLMVPLKVPKDGSKKRGVGGLSLVIFKIYSFRPLLKAPSLDLASFLYLFSDNTREHTDNSTCKTGRH